MRLGKACLFKVTCFLTSLVSRVSKDAHKNKNHVEEARRLIILRGVWQTDRLARDGEANCYFSDIPGRVPWQFA